MNSINGAEIDDDNAGRYRQQNVLISGTTNTPPDCTLLNDKMAQLVDLNRTGFVGDFFI